MTIVRSKIRWCGGFLLAVASLLAARADVVTVTTAEDTYSRQFSPDPVVGSEPSFVSGCLGLPANREIRRGFMRFDLANQIPAGAIVNSATLKITVVMVPRPRSDSIFDIHKVRAQWTESDLTWSSRLAGVPWQVPGAEGPQDVSPNSSGSIEMLDAGDYVFASTSSLVADVQSWVSDSANNFGWMLQSEDEQTPRTARRFGAREDPFHAPVLTIDYSLPTLGVVVQPSEQSVTAGSIVTFTASASGTPPFQYQWTFNATPLAGQTTDTLVISQVQTNQSGPYFVIVSNSAGSVTSAPAILNVTNAVPGGPIVTIVSPTNGAKFPAGSSVTLLALAEETNGNIAQVEFFLGGDSVGIVTNAPYTLEIFNLPSSNYVATARATDDAEHVGGSSPVSFSIVDPPGVAISSPLAGSPFGLGTDVLISANVTSRGGRISQVDFYAIRSAGDGSFETNHLGADSTPPYSIIWQPSFAGEYAVFAVVIDEFGQTGNSVPVSLRIFTPELVLPVIHLADAPRNFARVTTSPLLFTGTANDNIGLEHVEYQVISGPLLQNIGPILLAEGTTNWSAQVLLAPGNNAARFRSVDLANNKSAWITRYYTFFVVAPLAIQINGKGRVVPDLNGRDLQLGKRYTVSARPGPGYIFAGWENVSPTNNPTVTFEMSSNLTLVANFVPNPFPVASDYQGLFFNADTNLFRPEIAGEVFFHVGKDGRFSGRLRIGGRLRSFTGQFDSAGQAQVAIAPHGGAAIGMSLVLDLEGAGDIQGTVTTTSEGNTLTAPLLAQTNPFTRANPAPQAGDRPFLIQQISDTGSETFASGAARITSLGKVSIKGRINGGPAFALSAFVMADGSSPFYLTYNGGEELLIGWFHFGDSSDQNIAGQILHSQASVPVVDLLEVTAP